MKYFDLKISTLMAILVLLLLAGCGKKFKLGYEAKNRSSEWPFSQADLRNSNSIKSGLFSGKLKILWKKNAHDKLTGPMTLTYGYIIYPGARRKIRFYDKNTGTYMGRWKAKGFSPTGMVLTESKGFFALSPPRNRLEAIDLSKGTQLWKIPLRDATTGSIIVNDRLIVSSTVGRVSAHSLEDGELIWKFNCGSSLTSQPSVMGKRLFQTTDNGQIICLLLEDGNEIYRTEIGSPILSSAAVEKLLHCCDMTGNVFGINPDNGEIIWKKNLGKPIWSSPAVTDEDLFVSNSAGVLTALNASTGQIKWEFDTGEVIKVSPIVVDDYVIIATMRGNIFSLTTRDGNLVDKQELNEPVAFSPISDGKSVFVATQKGSIVSLGEMNVSISENSN